MWPEVQLGGVFGGLQTCADLLGAVVEYQCVVTALAVLAVADFLGLEAGHHRVVRMVASCPGKPGWRIAGGGSCALGNLIALRVFCAFAVVETTDDDGTVDVAFEVVQHDFLADARYEAAAPVGAC